MAEKFRWNVTYKIVKHARFEHLEGLPDNMRIISDGTEEDVRAEAQSRCEAQGMEIEILSVRKEGS